MTRFGWSTASVRSEGAFTNLTSVVVSDPVNVAVERKVFGAAATLYTNTTFEPGDDRPATAVNTSSVGSTNGPGSLASGSTLRNTVITWGELAAPGAFTRTSP